MENKRTFLLYPFLYILLILGFVIPFFVLLILGNMQGMTGPLVGLVWFTLIFFIGLAVWFLLFYFLNFTFYFKKSYPHKTDSLLLNTVINIILLIFLFFSNKYLVLVIFPAVNLGINIKYFFQKNKKTIKKIVK